MILICLILISNVLLDFVYLVHVLFIITSIQSLIILFKKCVFYVDWVFRRDLNFHIYVLFYLNS
jgi:hypothetical protein